MSANPRVPPEELGLRIFAIGILLFGAGQTSRLILGLFELSVTLKFSSTFVSIIVSFLLTSVISSYIYKNAYGSMEDIIDDILSPEKLVEPDPLVFRYANYLVMMIIAMVIYYFIADIQPQLIETLNSNADFVRKTDRIIGEIVRVGSGMIVIGLAINIADLSMRIWNRYGGEFSLPRFRG